MTKDSHLPNILLLPEPPLQILPSLAVCIGLSEAIILQQLHFHVVRIRANGWEDTHYAGGRWWVDRSIAQWQEKDFPFWSERTVQRGFSALLERNLIIQWIRNNDKGDNTAWYAVNYVAIRHLGEKQPNFTTLSAPAPGDKLSGGPGDKLSGWGGGPGDKLSPGVVTICQGGQGGPGDNLSGRLHYNGDSTETHTETLKGGVGGRTGTEEPEQNRNRTRTGGGRSGKQYPQRPESLDELADYFLACEHKGKRFSAEEAAELAETFFNHYEGNGWRVGKNKMVSWKHTAANWGREHLSRKASKPTGIDSALEDLSGRGVFEG